MTSSECSQNEACSNQKCVDPCPGTCGIGAVCKVVNHNPICSCPTSYTGNPFTRCQIIQRKPFLFFLTCGNQSQQNHNALGQFLASVEAAPPRDPCRPSPCGPFAECRNINDNPSCSCLPGYVGSPPNCKPECVSNSECSNHLACINQKCRDPCPGSCGSNAQCRVVSHTPNCFCLEGYVGDPFVQCTAQQGTPIVFLPEKHRLGISTTFIIWFF